MKWIASLLWLAFARLVSPDDQVTPPVPVPTALEPETAALLRLRYKVLFDTRQKLEAARLEQVAKCFPVPENDAELKAWCLERKAQIEADWKTYNDRKRTYETELRTAIDKELETNHKNIEGMRKELEKINERLKGYKESLDEWVHLNQEALTSSGAQAISFLTAGLLDHLRASKLNEVEITSEMKERARALLSRRLLDDGNLAKVKECLRRVDRRWASANTPLELISAIDLYRAEIATIAEAAISPNERELILKSALVLVEIACERLAQLLGERLAKKIVPPQLGILISGGEFMVTAAYMVKAQNNGSERVKQLLAVSEDELRAINSVSKTYKGLVNQRKELENAKKLVK